MLIGGVLVKTQTKNNSTDIVNFEDCPPKADAMIHSLRAFGYDLGMAVADLIDNSIFAEAANVWIQYDWNDGDPWIRIIDDGKGMSEERLVEAMTLGSTSPLEHRKPNDLGRFGLGLKTASFSQCKLVTVATRTSRGGEAVRFWDLDHVENVKKWELGKVPYGEVRPLLEPLNEMEHGTVVVWKVLDRIIDKDPNHQSSDEFNVKFLAVQKYLEMVFHQYLENKRKRLDIHVGVAKCSPWDPYLIKNKHYQELSDERYEDNKIRVTPYVLPHVSHRSTEENEKGGGLKGWNAQQGFYVYRNKRMIVSGGYLDFDLKPEEHYKLARIKVEITNDMDHEWSIDVRKAVASPPDRLRNDLLRIARVTRNKASEVYRARVGGGGRRNPAVTNTDDVWLKVRRGEKISYKLNLENPVLKKLIGEVTSDNEWKKRFCHVVESTVPHQLIIMDGLEYEDCHVDLLGNMNSPPDGLLEMCREFYDVKRGQGLSHHEAVDVLSCMEPFNTHPAFRAMLDAITV